MRRFVNPVSFTLSVLLTCIIGVSFIVTTPVSAQIFQTKARAAIVIDHNTGQVLLSKDADIPLPPASMSKLMTVNLLFEALADGRVT